MELQIIHVVLGKANPDRMNGVNKVVNSLAQHQLMLGRKASVWGITKTPTHNYPPREYETILFKDIGKFKISPELKSATGLLKNKPVIVHFHGGFIPQFYFIAKLLVENNVPYVFTPHGAFNTVALQRSKWKKKIYITLLEKYVVKHAQHVHLIGESEIHGTRKTFGDVPHTLIPNGQHESCNKTHILSKIGKTAPVFGFVGRLDLHTKGLDTLVQGFADYCHNTNKNSELRIVGDGPDRAKLEKLAQKLGLDSQMKFLGAKYGREKDELVGQFDFLCLVSRNEGLPGVVLEAACKGVPAIVSKETNMGRFISVSNAGFVIPQNSSSELSIAMNAAHESMLNSTYQKLSQNATKMVQNNFNWFGIAGKHIRSYEAN
ncbi:MAG: glycosyltransferase [Flavobacteriales bacterium]